MVAESPSRQRWSCASQGQFKPSAQALPAHGRNRDRRQFEHLPKQLAELRQHGPDMLGQVLLHAGAKTEMRAFRGENHHLGLRTIPQVLEGRSQSCHHCLIDDVGLGRSQCDTGDLAIVFEGEFQIARHYYYSAFVVSGTAQGAISAINASFQRAPSARR